MPTSRRRPVRRTAEERRRERRRGLTPRLLQCEQCGERKVPNVWARGAALETVLCEACETDRAVAYEESRIEQGQARWAETGSTRS